MNKKGWHVVYTRSRHEQAVFNLLEEQGIDCFLPMHKVLRYWKDRKKWLKVPLITAYVFVYVKDDREYINVLKTDGVVCFITFEGKAAIVPEKQIDNLKLLISSGEKIEVTDQQFEPGDEIIVESPPFKGLEGVLIMVKSRRMVKIQLDHVHKSIMVEISPGKLIKKKKDSKS